VGIPTVFNILENLRFKENCTTPYGHDLHTCRCYFTKETRIYYGLGVGISKVFEILGHLLFKGERDHEIFGHFLNQGDGTTLMS
jgi:hypothetical protein